MSETGSRSRGAEIDPSSIPGRIATVMVEAEQRRLSQLQLNQGMQLPGEYGALWQKITGNAQQTQDQIQQQGLEELFRMLPDDDSRKRALKHGMVSAGKFWIGYANDYMTRTGRGLPKDVWGLCSERITTISNALERLEGKPRPSR